MLFLCQIGSQINFYEHKKKIEINQVLTDRVKNK